MFFAGERSAPLLHKCGAMNGDVMKRFVLIISAVLAAGISFVRADQIQAEFIHGNYFFGSEKSNQ